MSEKTPTEAVAMTPSVYVEMLDRTLRGLTDGSQASSMRAYLLDQFDFLGIRAPVRRKAVQNLPKYVWQNPDDVVEVARLLWEKPEREFRYTAIDFLKRHVKILNESHLFDMLNLLQREPWWETVDRMSSVIGLLIRRQVETGSLTAQAMCDDWIKSPNMWVRRCAMLHQLGWRLKTDTDRLSHYSELLAFEKEFFIRKEIGWALRDYARWNPDWVRDFIEQKRDAFSGLTVREAAKHIF